MESKENWCIDCFDGWIADGGVCIVDDGKHTENSIKAPESSTSSSSSSSVTTTTSTNAD